MRIVFAGTPEFAAHHLSALIESSHNIVGVYTQPDRPAGRGKKLLPSAVKQLALEQGLPVYQPPNFKNTTDIDELASLEADVMVVVAYGLILPEAVLKTPLSGCINVHASLLPRWRGAAPIQRAIEAGDSESGVTIMQMDQGLDTGDMLAKESCAIESRDTAAHLHDKLVDIGKAVLLDTLKQIETGQFHLEPQDDSRATYAHKIQKSEALLDWSMNATTLDRKIRAFNPFPVCYSELGGQRIKIHQAFVLETNSSSQPGEIIATSSQGLDVQTGRGTLRIERLQMPGKKVLPVADILRGYADLFQPGALFCAIPFHSTPENTPETF
ncbi:MAG: methionyl-tRNA formyltransferase [Pseudomonadales bacterium]